jgi:hypothetical protein
VLVQPLAEGWSGRTVVLFAVPEVDRTGDCRQVDVPCPTQARAVVCAGPSTVSIAQLNVYRGSTLVRRSSVTSGTTFHFVLPLGTYVISNQGHPGRYVGSKPFRVRSGQTTHVTVGDYCK